MKHTITSLKLIVTSTLLPRIAPVTVAATLVAATLVAGCESTDGGNTGGGNVNTRTNYGTGMNDRWAPGGPSTTVQPTTGAGPR